jgi:hypothetical protein
MGVPASTMKTQETGSFQMLVTAHKASQYRNQETTLYIDFDILVLTCFLVLRQEQPLRALEDKALREKLLPR